MLASCHYTHKELMGVASATKHELLHAKGVNWAKQQTAFKRGRVIRRVVEEKTVSYTHRTTKKVHTAQIVEKPWKVDFDIPVFTKTPSYLDDLVPQL
jgi:tRNA(His) 5'-end guanylyltransferase